MKTRKVNIRKAFGQLPFEAQLQIQDVYCADEGKEIEELTIQELIDEVEWTIERMNMDISENVDIENAWDTIGQCKSWLTSYKQQEKRI